MNTPMILNFPTASTGHTASQPAIAPSALLSARVAVGIHNATRTMCLNVQHIDHAQGKARHVVFLMFMELLGRTAVDPTTTVNELLQAVFEQVPEDVMPTTGGAA